MVNHCWIIHSLFYFLFTVQNVQAQSFDTRLYTTLDGLSDNLIYSMYEDRLGYMWFGTGLGLDRFDGINFKHYGIVNGLPNLACNVMYEDYLGRFWVGTRNGIATFRKDSFQIYSTTDNTHLTYIFMFYEDAQLKLIANTLEGQYWFNGKQWEPYCIIETQNNEIIVSTGQTAEGEYFSTGFELFFRNKQNKVTSLWRQAASYPFFRGLLVFDNKVIVNANFTLYQINSAHMEPYLGHELKGYSISSFFQDSQKRLWFSTRKEGVTVLEERNKLTKKRTMPFRNNIALFQEDHAHQMWITTTQGVMKVLPQDYLSIPILEVKEPDHILNLIPIGQDGFLLSINNGQLLSIRYDINGSPTYQVVAMYSLSIPTDFVDDYSFGLKGDLWLVTRSSQLYQLKNGVLINKTSLVSDAGESFAFDVVCDPASNQIIVALDSMLVIGDENKLDTLFDNHHSYISNPSQLKIKKGRQLVIKTMDGEVLFYNLQDKVGSSFINMNLSPSPSRVIKLDHQQNLWIINGGQNMFRYSDGMPPNIKAEEIIDEVSDNINSFNNSNYFDQDQNIWCVNTRGVECLYQDQFQEWQSQSHIIYEISQAAYTDWFKVAASGNKIWVNLKNQLILFERSLPEQPKSPGKVILEEVQLHNQTIPWQQYTDSVYSYFEIPFGLILKYHQHTLTFNYNCPTILEEKNTSYSYRLLPLDTIWSKPSQNRSISFSQLKPANYTFQVRGRNKGTLWSDPTLFSFSIQKPFWDTTWFRFLLLVLASSLVAWVFRIRLRQERTKGEMKSQLLELEMRALRAQMNPHFIYNALNSIQSLVATNQTASANKYISMFARLLRQVLDNSRRSEITLKQELESLRLYIQLEQLRLDAEVNFVENIEDTVATDLIVVPPLILQPFVENALWHGLTTKEGDKRIELAVSAEDPWIRFTITDNGIGRQKAASQKSSFSPHESTAMQVTEQRLRDFNGALNVLPLQIQDLFGPDGSPAGTRIVLSVRKKTNIPNPT